MAYVISDDCIACGTCIDECPVEAIRRIKEALASFGAPECIRMSYATSDENIVEAIRRIKEALAKLK